MTEAQPLPPGTRVISCNGCRGTVIRHRLAELSINGQILRDYNVIMFDAHTEERFRVIDHPGIRALSAVEALGDLVLGDLVPVRSPAWPGW
jgi:hypothetical protein